MNRTTVIFKDDTVVGTVGDATVWGIESVINQAALRGEPVVKFNNLVVPIADIKYITVEPEPK